MVWEKGGSGLVFYTDASHWDQQDGGEPVHLNYHIRHCYVTIDHACRDIIVVTTLQYGFTPLFIVLVPLG